MSKTNLSRCAAVGIAGLTAMSSIAIVAAAATQASVVFEVKYGGLSNIKMLHTLGYVTGTNQYCLPTDDDGDNQINNGFNVSLAKLLGESATYFDADGHSQVFENIWSPASYTATGTSGVDHYFVGKESYDGGLWKYKAFTPTSGFVSEEIKLAELYGARGGNANENVFVFKTDSDRTAAVSSMVGNIKTDYSKLAANANAQFVKDINDAKNQALSDIAIQLKDELATAKATKEAALEAAGDDKDAKKEANDEYNATVKTTNNKYAAAKKVVTSSASKIISEFKATFQAGCFNYSTTEAFQYYNAPITYAENVGGYTIGETTYAGLSNGNLDNAMYWTGNTAHVDDASYVFKGEIQPKDVITAGPSFVYIGGTLGWIKYEVIKNNSTSGGNTDPSGSDNKDDNKEETETKTTWYPDSASYRNPSEVSYQGKNGSWYTSKSAANLYGGGYNDVSKASNFNEVNNSANGKAIYFNSATGTYSTTSTTYSYVVKEATESNNSDDPYYNYFFGNGNSGNNTTTTAPAGSPAISGASKYAGWTNISAYLTKRGKSGATYTINMNDGNIVPAAVLATAKSKNITLVFANDNGSKVTVKPGKVDTSSDLNVAVKYNVKDVKSSLVAKAKKVNKGTVSTAQIRVGDDGSIGGSEIVTVKFSTKRSGCTVKAYRLTESGSLKKEATSTVASTGRVNLNLTKGGSYLLVVIDD